MLEFRVSSKDLIDRVSTSKGDQKKWYKQGYYIKANKFGYENIAEIVVAELCRNIKGLNFVDYCLCDILDIEVNKRYLGCYSQEFKPTGFSFITFDRLLQLNLSKVDYNKLGTMHGEQLYLVLCGCISKMTGIDIFQYINQCIALDAITLNEDRHFNNMGVLFSERGIVYSVPIFDNGLSLLSDKHDYPMNIDINILIRRVKSLPFSRSFSKQISYMHDFEPFLIDIDKLYYTLDSFVPDCLQAEYNRAVAILKYQLNKYKGVLWYAI